MADRIENDIIEEGYTEFAEGGEAGQGPYYYPTGVFGRFFAKFFATKAVPVLAKDKTGEQAGYDGDVIISQDTLKPENPHSPSILKTAPSLPQIENVRRARYADYEVMDEYPELGTAFDMYADDCTQLGFKNEHWTIESKNDMVVDELKNMFKTIDLSRFIWDISRNTVKYGDCFIELVVDLDNPGAGIQRLKVLDPRFILRVENEYGYLTDFLQEIPKKGNSYNSMFGGHESPQYIKLDRHQIVHFRLHTSNSAFYPYGKSIAALCHRTFRSLKLMEDAMLIYRLSRAPERRIFYIDVGNLPSSRSEMYIERLKEKFKKEKFYDTRTDTVDARYNPMSADEDFFVPMKGGSGTKIETLPGAQNLGEVEDVSYFRDKLLTALKIPKDYFVEKDGSGERKANLAQLDVKFARTILRVQQSIQLGIEAIAKRHLQLKGFPEFLVSDVKIKLPEPSDMFAKRKLDIDEQKTRVVAAVQQLGLLPKDTIYKEYFNYSENEIEEIKAKLEKEAQEATAQAPEQGQGPTSQPGPGEAGGQEGAENVPPTANEGVIDTLTKIKDKVLLEEDSNWKHKALNRVIQKQKIKEEVENIEQ